MIHWKISVEDKKLFLSGIGVVLYPINLLRPDIANAIWELCMVMDDMNQAVFIDVLWVIKYVLNTRSLELKLEQTKCFSVSD